MFACTTSICSIKELWLGTKAEGCSVLLAAMWMTKWKKVGGEKERWSLSVHGNMLPKFAWDGERMRVTASWERGRSTSTPSARNGGKKICSEIQKGLDMDFVATQEATASCWSGSNAR